MNDHVETLRNLDQGQALRLTFADGRVVRARANQFDYAPAESFRLEFSTDASGDHGRYQAFASAEGGEWSPVEVRRHDRGADDWSELVEVTEVTPLDATQFRESEDYLGSRM